MSPRKRATVIAVLMSCAFGGVIAAATPPTAKMGGTPGKTRTGGDGSVFGEIIPAELEQRVTVKPSWLPLSKQLSALQDATTVPLTHAPSAPDDPLFVAAPGRTEFSLLHQMRLLLTDDQWQYQWANKDLGKDHRSYRLWREAVSPQERRARMAKAAKDRLAKVLALLSAGPAAWDAARGEDPDLSNGIRQPICQAPLLLAAKLSPDHLDSILMGQPLTLRVADMSPQDQPLVRQSASAVPMMTGTATRTSTVTGATTVIFNMEHLLTSGEVVFETVPLIGDPGSLDLAMHVYTEPAHEFGEGSNGMLYMAATDFAPNEKDKITSRHRQEASDALAVKTPGAKTVTIEASAKPEQGEPQMAVYLRAFAEQTKLTVLAHWPQDGKDPDKALPASIVNKPVGEALDILCKTYRGEWVQDEQTVRLRALPAEEPEAKKPPIVSAAPVPTPPANSSPSR